MNRETFSIVIPVHNRAGIVSRTLESIVAQSYRPLHIVLVDNNSTDGTFDILRQWKEFHQSDDLIIDVIREKRKGASAARNAGLALVSSRFSCFFDSDDIMHPELAAEAMKALTASPMPENSVVAWRAIFKDSSGASRRLRYSSRNPLRNHLLHGILATQRTAASTSLYRRAGGWNESLPCWNDLEFGVRVLLCHPHFSFINKDLVTIHFTSHSITGRNFTHRAGEWEMSLQSIERALRTTDDERDRSLMSLLEYRRAVLAGHYLREAKSFTSSRGKTSAEVLTNRLSKSPFLTKFQRRLLRPLIIWTIKVNKGMATLFSIFF